jgi:acetyl esterase/lipase
MQKSFTALWSAVALCLASPGQAAETGIQYGPDPAQLLDVCRPAMARHAPAMLMIHGGGWYQGSRTQQAAACEMVAQTGVVAIPVDYRLLSAELSKKWPLQFNDVQLAMRWVRSHAAELGIDPNHICAEGDSAGGQLALMLDVVPGIGPGDAQTLLSRVSPRADCVVSISGPSDLLSIETAHPGYGNVLVGPGDPAFRNARKRDASPALRVAPGDGPALLIHGLDDPAVPFAQAVEMQAAFARVGTPAWLISHPGGHEFRGMSVEQSHAIWGVIGAFVRSRHLAGPPRQIAMGEILP